MDDDDNNHTPNFQGNRKRAIPDSGHSPNDVPRRVRMDSESESIATTTDNTNPNSDEMLRNSGNTGGKPIEMNQVNTRRRVSFVIEGKNALILPRMDLAVGAILEKSSTIIDSRISKNQRAILFKTKSDHGDPNRDLNWMLIPENLDILKTKYGDQTLEVLHHDTTRKIRKNEQFHAIAKSVPIEYTEDEFLKELRQHYADIEDNIVTCSRIWSQKFKQFSYSIRIVCKDQQTSDRIIQEGVLFGARFFRCEKPHPQPDVRMCYRCQSFEHSDSRRCTGTQHCVKCGENHRVNECKKTKEEYVCINCGEGHAAWSVKCKKYRKVMEEQRKNDTVTVPPLSETAVNGSRPNSQVPQTAIDKTTPAVAKMMEEVKSQYDTKLKQIQAEVNKKIENGFNEMKMMITTLTEKLDECMKTTHTPISPGGESSIHKLHNKIDNYKTKLELIDARLSTQPGLIKDEIENSMKKQLEDHNDKLKRKIIDCKNQLDVIPDTLNEKFTQVTEENTKVMAKLDNIDEYVSTHVDRALAKRRALSIGSQKRRPSQASQETDKIDSSQTQLPVVRTSKIPSKDDPRSRGTNPINNG